MRFQCVVGAGAAVLAAPLVVAAIPASGPQGPAAAVPTFSKDVAPPWHADAPAGTFENERRLSDAEKQTLLG